ncbi:MAG TPA: SGNH/GDSL hydrolase family protein, partial [Acidimicrobiales bacterium]|nr:SGNH/GDSL hydrolase family protein [Acidimicrobiales bacterium]
VTTTYSLSGEASANPPPSSFYLAVGASESLGFQPTPDTPHGVPTDEGYANDLVSYEAARGITLDLTQVGCPGETTTTMLSGNDHCYGGVDTQLATAMNFLSEHQGEQGIVTIDLGFNDVRHCMRHQIVDEACVKQQLDDVRSDVPLIVQSLKSVAGPDVTFVGLGHYDPYLAYELEGGDASVFARESEHVMNRLNGVLRYAYSSDNVPMADVDEFFDGRDRTPVELSGVGMVPNDVAHICQLTWMCATAPYGPDFHPDDAGYATIAAAIEAVLPSPW